MSESEDTLMNSGGDQPGERETGELPAELKSFEARLATLSPRDDRLDRERLMFLAGQASVESKAATFTVQNWQRHPAWPAAFAAMSAAAATLLAVLISRPTPIDSPATPARDFAQSTAMPKEDQIADDRSTLSHDVLTTSDAHHGDIEKLLAGRNFSAIDANVANARAAQFTQQPTLTPAAWEQVIVGPDNARPPLKDSSNRQSIRGFTT